MATRMAVVLNFDGDATSPEAPYRIYVSYLVKLNAGYLDLLTEVLMVSKRLNVVETSTIYPSPLGIRFRLLIKVTHNRFKTFLL